MFDNISVGGVATALVILGVAIWAFKFAVPSQLAATTNSLLEKRTTERDDALRERDGFKKEKEQLEEEIKTYRREIVQRIDINLQDQQTIRELREKLKE